MKTSRIFIYVVTFFFLILLTGCIGVNRQFSEISDKIIGGLDNNYKTEFQFSIGSSAITISSWFVDLAADEEYIDEMMREISSVQVGIYNRLETIYNETTLTTLQSIDEEMRIKGWKYIVRSVDNNELTAIYLSADPVEILKKMYIINLRDEKLVIIEVNGDLKKAISYAIEERNFRFKM